MLRRRNQCEQRYYGACIRSLASLECGFYNEGFVRIKVGIIDHGRVTEGLEGKAERHKI